MNERVCAIEGEIVSCPLCDSDIYRLRCDLSHYTPVSSRQFEPLAGSSTLLDGTVNPCPNCKGNWFPHWLHLLNYGAFRPVKIIRAA